MNKVLVLYESKYGATKKYAHWLKEELDCDAIETKSATIKDVINYDTIILGGGIYGGSINGLSFLRGHIDELLGKKIVVFAVGATPYSEEYTNKIKEHTLKGKLEGIPLYYCRGEWNEELFSFKDKLLIGMFKKMLAKKDKNNMPDYEREMIDSLGSKQDWCDKKYIIPILKSI